MSKHDFCRVHLHVVLDGMREPDPVRYLKAEIGGEIQIGNHKTYWVEVTDWRDPQTGRFFPTDGAPGHFRKVTYEVEGCCRWDAKVNALQKLEAVFDPPASDNVHLDGDP